MTNQDNGFVHLHLHSEYSLLDGAANIKKVIKKAKDMGMTSLAITDHGVMYGVIDFYLEAIANGIKPIIGCEVYTAPGSRFNKYSDGNKPYGHLILLCKNETGYRNLMALVTKASIEGYYYKPRVDMELLRKHSEGLIALSGCLRGDVPMAYLSGGYGNARAKAMEYISIFGRDNYYLEIQNHGIIDETKVAQAFKKLSSELGVGLVATNDVHYTNKEDALIQDVLSCIQTGKLLSDTDRMKMSEEEYYLKSFDEMKSAFYDYPESLANTVKIAEMCNLEIDMSSVHLPRIDVDTSMSHEDYLKSLCLTGLKTKYNVVTHEHLKRLEYELDTINSMGYTDYFLIVYDIIKYAKSNNIPIGPGRGSAAGSLASYALNITEIDPVSNGLIFERFLNPERVSMPDIDIDICYEKRDELREYVSRKYGSDKVAQIVTFGTLAAKAAIKDVARVMGVDINVANKVSKAIGNALHITLSEALETSGDLQEMYTSDYQIKKLIDIAMELEGFPRHTSTHAAGIVIAEDELSHFVPLQNSEDGLVTQYHMTALEKIGMLKMDFLGLRNLTVIKDCIESVNQNLSLNLDIESIPLDDYETFGMIQKGDTDAVFQLENPGLQSFLRKFRPGSVDDIVITTSIYRPGPMDQIPAFLSNVKNPDKIVYKHPLLEPILKPTYGVVVYQEQVMDIVRTLGGYSMGRADLVRRAMAKKKQDIMQKERDIFINGLVENGTVLIDGAKRRGVDEITANDIFDSLIDFANYAFNKSHAACYALVAYRTAYLKAHYPTFYLASVLKNYMGHTAKCSKYISSFKKYGIRLLPPDVNRSFSHISVEGNNLRFGISWLKNMGMSFPANIEKERTENGEFKSFTDFVQRMSFYDLSKRSVESMIKCGCFDSIYSNRRVLMFNYERIVDSGLNHAKDAGKGQVSWFDSSEDNGEYSVVRFRNADIKDYTLNEKLNYEYDIASMYFSGHPLDAYAAKVNAFSDISISDAVDNIQNDGRAYVICGRISDISVRRTKKGRQLANMVLSDYSSDGNLIVFESVYLRYRDIICEGAIVAATVTLSAKDDDSGCDMILKGISDMESLKIPDEKTLYIRLRNDSMLSEVKNLCLKYPGKNMTCIYVENTSLVFRSDSTHGVNLNGEVFNKISAVLGSENVKIK